MRGRKWGEPKNFTPLLGLLYWLGGDLTRLPVHCWVSPKGPPPQKLERERLRATQAIRRFAVRAGRAPTILELGRGGIQHKHPMLPSYTTLIRLFGTLRKAYISCNLKPPQKHKKRKRKSAVKPLRR